MASENTVMAMSFAWRAPIVLCAQALAFPIAPWAAVLADEDGRLPWALRWLETHDAPGWAGPMSVPALRRIITEGRPKWALTRWLWRNKAYRVAGWLGASIHADEVYFFEQCGDMVPPEGKVFSYWFGAIDADGQKFFEVQPRICICGVVFYARIGWKLRDYFIACDNGSEWPKQSSQAGMFNAFSPRIKSMDGWK